MPLPTFLEKKSNFKKEKEIIWIMSRFGNTK